jgi:hypothetical protein
MSNQTAFSTFVTSNVRDLKAALRSEFGRSVRVSALASAFWRRWCTCVLVVSHGAVMQISLDCCIGCLSRPQRSGTMVSRIVTAVSDTENAMLGHGQAQICETAVLLIQ